MKDILRFKHSYYLDLDSLISEGKVIQGRLKKLIPYSGKKVFLYDNSYSLEEGAVKKIAERNKAKILIGLDYIYYKEGVEKSKAISKLKSFINLLYKYKVGFFVASLAREKENIRTFRERVYASMLLGLSMELAKKSCLEGLYD